MSTTFFKGLVVDVLDSTSTLSVTNDSRADLQKSVTAEAMKNFPRNTLVVKTVSEGQAKKSGVKVVCYPFFSSHLCMPIKPGEYVWFVYENPDSKGSIAYWLSRVSEPNHVEDVNYTFSTRSYIQSPNKPAKKSSEKFDGAPAEDGEVQTFSWQSPTSDPKEMVNLVELAKKKHRFQAVPRYTKRPSDLILQGSNNSLIMLGEERGHWAPDNFMPSSANSPPDKIEPGHPAIDIVVGRGSKASELDSASVGLASGGSYFRTSGKSITNEFGVPEIDKRESSNVEGDAHFVADATRIYLTANSSNINSSYHPDLLLGTQLPAPASLREEPTFNEPGAFAVIKSDNLRLVSRAVGSIRIVKEPTNGKDDGAAIMIYKDGEVQLAANRITLSRYNSDGATEPYLKQSAMVAFLSSLLEDLTKLISQIASAGSSLTTSTNAGGPVPGAQAAGVTLASAATTASASVAAKIAFLKINTADGKTPLGSTLIYGE